MKKHTDIQKIYYLSFFSNLFFILSFITPMYIKLGLNNYQILLLQSIYTALIFLFEIPSGAFSDTFGRKTTIIIASIAYCFGWISLIFAHNFFTFIIYQLFLAIGVSFNSGTLESFIYDHLKQYGKEEEYKSTNANFNSYKFKALAISGIIGTFLYWLIGFNWTLVFTVLASLISVIISFLLHEPYDEISQSNKRKKYFRIISESGKLLLKNSKLKLYTFESVFVYWITGTYFNFNLIFLKKCGFPVLLNGIYTSIIFILASYCLKKYNIFENIVKGEIAFLNIIKLLLALLILIVPFISNGYILALLWLPIFILNYLRGPMISSILNKNIDSSVRATTLSFVSMFKNIGIIIWAPVFGYLSDLQNGTLIVSLTSSIALILILVLVRSIAPNLTNTKDQTSSIV
ncbi:MAG: MFS transporter [Lutisporaceae bacterium]